MGPPEGNRTAPVGRRESTCSQGTRRAPLVHPRTPTGHPLKKVSKNCDNELTTSIFLNFTN